MTGAAPAERPSAAEVVLLRLQVLGLTGPLVREDRGRLAVGVVVRAVATARDEVRAAWPHDDLPAAVEALAGQRLDERPSRV